MKKRELFRAIASKVWNAYTDAKNDKTTIVLPGDPDAGYAWQYALQPDGVLREVASAYAPGTDGKSGHFTWTFAGENAGTCQVRFQYAPTFADQTPRKRIDYTFSVDAHRRVTFQTAQQTETEPEKDA